MKQHLLIPLLFVGACSDDGGGGGSVTVEQFGTRAADATCAYEFRCCDDAERMMDFQFFKTSDGQPITTQAQCDTVYEGLLGALLVAQWNDSIMKGRVTFDGSAAAGCLALIDGLACGQKETVDLNQGSCAPYLIPLVENDGACAQDYECKSGNCVGATSGNGSGSAAMDGACKPLPGMGEACSGNCAKGYFCDFGASGETCVPTLGDGMDCTSDDECTSGNCNDMGQCGADAPRCTGA